MPHPEANDNIPEVDEETIKRICVKYEVFPWDAWDKVRDTALGHDVSMSEAARILLEEVII